MDKNLAGALLQAQAGMGRLVYDSNNPHFKSKYASLTAVLDTVRGPLSEAGLVLYQSASAGDGVVMVRTMLVHAASGESIEEVLPLPVTQQTPQAYGSAITYGRRYLAMAMCGLAPDDDDGNESSQKAQNRTQSAPPSNRTATHRNTPQRPANPVTREIDSITVADAEPLDDSWDGLVEYADANRAADKKAAAPFVWPVDGEMLELCTALMNHPDLPRQPYRLIEDIKGADGASKAMSEKQYGFMTSLLDKRYNGGHNAILSALCGRVINHENPTGFGVKKLIDWMKEPADNVLQLEVLDELVVFLKQDIEQFEVA